jgi:nucleoside-diphosphate-sugar epimerase
MRLFIFGFGYSARHFVGRFGGAFAHVAATVRDVAERDDRAGVEVHPFPNDRPDAALAARVREADVLLVSIPPGAAGDPVISAFADVLATGSGQKTIYLSTIGVYGDHGGAWVDESTPASAGLERTRMRLEAEQAWRDATRGDVVILRLAGIYGPGRNALATLRAGSARRIVKPGQVFNRIHVDDIAAAVMAATGHPGSGAFNVCDDEPAPPQDVIAYAAKLMGIAPPAEEAFETAEMSAMARSFYAGNARVANARLKRELGVALTFPNYRQGLDALWRAGEGR